LDGQPELPEVAQAIDALGAVLGFGSSRQQHRREDGDDRNHDQQLDKRESSARVSANAGHDFGAKGGYLGFAKSEWASRIHE
jgi:hypothetical protein